MSTLLAIIPDSLNNILKKGEVIGRYYNPGDLFDEIHLISTSPEEQVADCEKLQKMAGRAKVYSYFLPLPSFVKTLGWRRCFLRGWLRRGEELAKKIKPDVIRCYDNWAGGFLGARLKRVIDVPMILSLHNASLLDKFSYRKLRMKASVGPDFPGAVLRFIKGSLVDQRRIFFEKCSITSADIVLPVYESLNFYALKMGGSSVKVCYNVINPENSIRKSDYQLHAPARIICVSNQHESKNPENIVRAMALLRNAGINAELWLIGDGPINGYLRKVAENSAASDKVKFYKSIGNDELCRNVLPNGDIFAVHTNYAEISKAVLESLLAGLPVVINRLELKSLGFDVAPELAGGVVDLVENTPEGYFGALKKLLTDDALRQKSGSMAYEYAASKYSPESREKVFVKIYENFLNKKNEKQFNVEI